MPGHDIHELYRQSRRAAFWGCAVSLGLALMKLAGGWFGHSVALLADAIHSFGDAFLAGTVWAALRWSQRPADREHPYGHSRAEAVAGFSIALLLIFSAFAAGWESLRAFTAPPDEPPSDFTLLIAAVSFFLNEGLYQRNRRVARRTGSSAVQAAAWDQRLDALTAVAILAALGLTMYAGPAWRLADPVAGLGVALIVLVVGARLFWSSLHELMDAQADPELVEALRREALTVAGVRGVEKVFVRKTGLEYLVDMHVEVDPEAPVREGHAIGHAVKDVLIGRFAPVKDVLVHIEPAPNGAARGGGHRGLAHKGERGA
jgi:cation diffusion facilitator family transporter